MVVGVCWELSALPAHASAAASLLTAINTRISCLAARMLAEIRGEYSPIGETLTEHEPVDVGGEANIRDRSKNVPRQTDQLFFTRTRALDQGLRTEWCHDVHDSAGRLPLVPSYTGGRPRRWFGVATALTETENLIGFVNTLRCRGLSGTPLLSCLARRSVEVGGIAPRISFRQGCGSDPRPKHEPRTLFK